MTKLFLTELLKKLIYQTHVYQFGKRFCLLGIVDLAVDIANFVQTMHK